MPAQSAAGHTVRPAVPCPRARDALAAQRPPRRPRRHRAAGAAAPQRRTHAHADPIARRGLSRRRPRTRVTPMAKGTGKAYYMISVVAQRYNIHPQTLRLYEREGLLKPSRTDGNTRLYSEDDLERLETILTLTRDLGVNLAGVEIILNMRRKIEQMQGEVNEFMEYVKRELSRGIGDWEQRLSTALVKSSPTDLVRASQPSVKSPEAPAKQSSEEPARKRS